MGAYYLCALLMAQHYLLALPLPSSFAPGQLVQRRVEARLMTAFLVVVPALMHALTFAHALPLAPALHAANTALLVALPLLYLALCSLAGHAPLWWTGAPHSAPSPSLPHLRCFSSQGVLQWSSTLCVRASGTWVRWSESLALRSASSSTHSPPTSRSLLPTPT